MPTVAKLPPLSPLPARGCDEVTCDSDARTDSVRKTDIRQQTYSQHDDGTAAICRMLAPLRIASAAREGICPRIEERSGLGTLSLTISNLCRLRRHVSREEEKGFYKLLPANKADHLCQLWQKFLYVHECVCICVRVKVRGAAIPLTKIAASQPLRCA